MLNFSKTKILTIYLLFIIISIFGILNFSNEKFKYFERKINLGLDLQGGSYLLLEIDTKPLIKERIQSKVKAIKSSLNDSNIIFKDFEINDDSLSFRIENNDINKFETLFINKNNQFNTYIDKYNTN